MSRISEEEEEKITSLFIKAKAWKNLGIPVHILLKNNKGWENGFIREVQEDFLKLEYFEEFKEKHKWPIEDFFFYDIEDIEAFKQKEDKNVR